MDIIPISKSIEPEPKSVARIRSLGSYYTPDKIATAVAGWAIRSGHERILEPSAGAGALLRAAYAKAKLVSSFQDLRATAFDIDSQAILHLNALNLEGLTVCHSDFLAVQPEDYGKFDLVLANPPFTRNHSLPPEQRSALRAKFGTKGAVGLWVHILLHSLNFLKTSGRVASIVPRSVLFTDHGDRLLRQFSSCFESVGIYELSSKPKWSNHAEEAGAVILASGYKCGSSEAYERGLLEDDGSITPNFSRSSYPFLQILKKCIPLENLATLSIGAVTGRNDVFLLTEDERKDTRIDFQSFCPVVSRRKQISGITLTKDDLATLASEGQKTWMLYPDELTESVENYLARIPKEDHKKVVWFKKRSPWWKIQLASQYDAVFTYMNDLGPRLVKLESGIVCTNTLHRVEFKATSSELDRAAALLSPISTFGQLAAEKIGRVYSGGVLKFELREARQLPIFSAPAFNNDLVKKVDNLLRGNALRDATLAVDEAFMPHLFGKPWHYLQKELEVELAALRSARRQKS